jgi:hypothetical protein
MAKGGTGAIPDAAPSKRRMTGVDEGCAIQIRHLHNCLQYAPCRFLQRHPKMLFHKHAKLIEAGTLRRGQNRGVRSQLDASSSGGQVSHLRQATDDPTTPLAEDGGTVQALDEFGAPLPTSSPGFQRQSSKVFAQAVLVLVRRS